jgi:hypothetical protein
LPLFRAAADGLIALLHVEDTRAVWPSALIERELNKHRPVCFLIGGIPASAIPIPLLIAPTVGVHPVVGQRETVQ